MIGLLKKKSKYNLLSNFEKELFEMFFSGFKNMVGGTTFDNVVSSEIQTEMLEQIEEAVWKMFDNMPSELAELREKFKHYDEYYEQRFQAIESALLGANKMATIVYVPPIKPPKI